MATNTTTINRLVDVIDTDDGVHIIIALDTDGFTWIMSQSAKANVLITPNGETIDILEPESGPYTTILVDMWELAGDE